MSSRFILPFADVGSGIKPSSGAKLFFFETDGVTPKNTFSDQLSTPTANTNPVIANSNGVFGNIFIVGDYKVTLEDKNGSQIFGLAPVTAILAASDFSDRTFNFDTLALWQDESDVLKVFSGAFSVLEEIESGNGDGFYGKVITGTGTANNDTIFAHNTLDLSLEIIQRWGAQNLIGYEVYDSNFDRPYRMESDYDIVSGTTFGIAHTGQSLAEGGVGGDIVSGVDVASFPDRVYMFLPQPVGLSNDVLSTAIGDLVEPTRVTIGHSLTRVAATGNTDTILFSGQAWGGQPYSELKKGAAKGVFEKVTTQVSNAFTALPDIKYLAVTNIHGEQDGLDNNTTYAADLNEWQTDFNADIKTITGQSEDVTMFICQTSTAGGYGFNGGISELTFPTPLEQLEAHETFGSIVLVAPKYFLAYNDHSHIKNISQRILGEYYAKAYIAGNSYEPVRPSVITPSGSTVVIDFVGNVGTLVLDTTLVQSITNSGFSYVDDSARTITGIAITGTSQVTVSLSGAVGTNAVVAYAYHNGAGGATNQVNGLGDRGNLRDSDTVISVYDSSTLHNYCVTFRKAVN